MRGATFASAVRSAATVSLTFACAASTGANASTRPWRAWTSVAVVYETPTRLNCPFGKFFFVPAMSAWTRVRALALLLFDVDMTVSFGYGAHDRRHGEPLR